jgi:hypothetical protein
MTSLSAATSNSDCRRRSHQDCRATAEIAPIDTFLNEQLFSTRDEARIEDGFGHRARSVLTYIDKLDKRLKGAGVRETYEFMSEWCHPNGSGHLFTYGEINKSTGTVTFSEATPRVRGIQGHVVTCYMMILFLESLLTSLDDLIPLISKLDGGDEAWSFPKL